jgi:hypothetical protein
MGLNYWRTRYSEFGRLSWKVACEMPLLPRPQPQVLAFHAAAKSNLCVGTRHYNAEDVANLKRWSKMTSQKIRKAGRSYTNVASFWWENWNFSVLVSFHPPSRKRIPFDSAMIRSKFSSAQAEIQYSTSSISHLSESSRHGCNRSRRGTVHHWCTRTGGSFQLL